MYVSAERRYDTQVALLAVAGGRLSSFAIASAHALLTLSADQTLFDADPKARAAILSPASVIERLAESSGDELVRNLIFERVVLDVCAHQDPDGETKLGDLPAQAQATAYERNVAFLMKNDRFRKPIDRELLQTVASCLRGDAIFEDGDEAADLFCDYVKSDVLGQVDIDDLYDWAVVAMHRPDVDLKLTSEDSLQASFLAYAIRVWNDVRAHLWVKAREDQVPVAA